MVLSSPLKSNINDNEFHISNYAEVNWKNSTFEKVFLIYTVLILFITFYVLEIIDLMGKSFTSMASPMHKDAC